MLGLEGAVVIDTEGLLQGVSSIPSARSGSRRLSLGSQPRPRPSSRHSLDCSGRASVILRASSGHIASTATAVSLERRPATADSLDLDASWQEQRRLLEESYQATAAPMHVSLCNHTRYSGSADLQKSPFCSPITLCNFIFLVRCRAMSQARSASMTRTAEGTEHSSSAEEQAEAVASDDVGVRSGRRTARVRSSVARRRSLSRDSDRLTMRSRARMPAGRSSSLGPTPERSLARRRLARRSCITSVVAARADVRRIRQRRLKPANPLARTEEAAEEKMLRQHTAELMRARADSKSTHEVSSRYVTVLEARCRQCCIMP